MHGRWLLLLLGLPRAGLCYVHSMEYAWPDLDLHQQGRMHQQPSLLWQPWQRLGVKTKDGSAATFATVRGMDVSQCSKALGVTSLGSSP